VFERSPQQAPSRVETVKGILVFWKAVPFAGHCRNEGLGRSVERSGYPPEANGAPMTADVRRQLRRGTSSACATKRMHSTRAREIVHVIKRRTRPSLGPSTCARRSSLHIAAQVSMARRSCWHHGWANLGNQEEPALGPARTNGAQLATRHRFARRGRDAERKGRRSRSPSLREQRRVWVWLPARRKCSCRSR